MATITVRVNPDNPEEYAVSECGELWWKQSSWGTLTTDNLRGWQEFELEIPKPKRVPKAGDIYRGNFSNKIYIRGNTDLWMFNGRIEPQDEFIQNDKKLYTYIGNINDIENVKL